MDFNLRYKIRRRLSFLPGDVDYFEVDGFFRDPTNAEKAYYHTCPPYKIFVSDNGCTALFYSDHSIRQSLVFPSSDQQPTNSCNCQCKHERKKHHIA